MSAEPLAPGSLAPHPLAPDPLAPDPLAPDASAAAIASAVRGGSVTALAVVEATLARIAARDPVLNAFTAVFAERARRTAAAIDAEVDAGGDPGPLAGVPLAVKNLFDVAGEVTLAGSRINAGHPPAAADATAIRRLEAAGAVLVGALNMDEYAYGFTTENSHHGPCRNPHDPSRVAGGSSGGSGAAVGGGLVPLSLGSDTNGSVRVPSALCGIFGIKPTYGRLSRAGMYPFVASLDHTGVFARSVADLAIAYDIAHGPDPLDPVCAERPCAPTLPGLDGGAGGLRVAVLGGWFAGQGDPVVHAAVGRVAAALGATATVTFPKAEVARAAAFVITGAEGAALHMADLRARAGDFDPLTRDRFLAGALIPARWVYDAQRFRRWYRDRVAEVLADWDVVLAPTTPWPATPIGQETMELGGRSVPTRPFMGVFTQPISCIGLPVVAVPVAGMGRLPVGVQLIGRPWSEPVLMRAAAALEAAGVVAAPVPATLRG